MHIKLQAENDTPKMTKSSLLNMTHIQYFLKRAVLPELHDEANVRAHLTGRVEVGSFNGHAGSHRLLQALAASNHQERRLPGHLICHKTIYSRGRCKGR